MIIEIGTIRSHVVDATEEEHSWLADFLAWPDDKLFMRKNMGHQVGDGYVRLYNRVDDDFPAGMTRMVVKGARAAGYQVKLKDARVKPANPITPNLSWLRDYQVEAKDAAIKRTRGLIWAATGAGKTEIAVGIVESVPVPWLFLVHREQLARQAAERYTRRTGQQAGSIDDLGTGHSFTVCTFQGLWAALKRNDKRVVAWLATVGGLIVDECHVVPAATFKAVLDYVPAYWRIGISGTPLARGDRKSMHIIGCLGPVINRISAQMLIDRGLLARPIIRMVRHDEESEKKTYAGAYNELVFRSKSRNRLVLDLITRAVRPTLVFVRLVKHGKALLKALLKRGVNAEYVDGGAVVAVREAAVRRLERGDTDVLITNVVMNEGVDFQELRSVVLAAAGASTIEVLQRVGRGMRVVPGKTTFEVWDVWDAGNKFTERHSKSRRRAYEVEDYTVEVVSVDQLNSAPPPVVGGQSAGH
jgi:superfamily II DNA or RNA helicase